MIPSDIPFSDLARITGRHVESLRRMARKGKLTGAYRLGGRWILRREALDFLRGMDDEQSNDGTDVSGATEAP